MGRGRRVAWCLVVLTACGGAGSATTGQASTTPPDSAPEPTIGALHDGTADASADASVFEPATAAAAGSGPHDDVGTPPAIDRDAAADSEPEFDTEPHTDARRDDGDAEPLVEFDLVAADAPAPRADLIGCPEGPRGAVADKANQRYWLCENGAAITDEIPMTTASANYGLPPIGTYQVFARDRYATGIGGEPLERFVAFYTTPKGNRIAFHEVVDQDPATVGDLDQRGASAGCFRIRSDDSERVWDFLRVGDPVAVISN
ncbi:MAG: L,D-transpeptidase [Actinomycetota bacterium]